MKLLFSSHIRTSPFTGKFIYMEALNQQVESVELETMFTIAEKISKMERLVESLSGEEKKQKIEELIPILDFFIDAVVPDYKQSDGADIDISDKITEKAQAIKQYLETELQNTSESQTEKEEVAFYKKAEAIGALDMEPRNELEKIFKQLNTPEDREQFLQQFANSAGAYQKENAEQLGEQVALELRQFQAYANLMSASAAFWVNKEGDSWLHKTWIHSVVGLFDKGYQSEAENKFSNFLNQVDDIEQRILQGESFRDIFAEKGFQELSKTINFGISVTDTAFGYEMEGSPFTEIKENPTQEDVFKFEKAVLEKLRDRDFAAGHSDLARDMATQILADEIAEAEKQIAEQTLEETRTEAEKKIDKSLNLQTLIGQLATEYSQQGIDKSISEVEAEAQAYRELMIETQYQKEKNKIVGKHIHKNSLDDQFSADKKAIWDEYKDANGYGVFDIADETWDFIIEELVVNAPLIIISGGTAALARGAISAATRSVIARTGIGAARLANLGKKGRIMVQGAGLLTEGAAFSASNAYMKKGLHELGLEKEEWANLPEGFSGWAQDIFWSTAMLGAFKGAHKLTNKFGTKVDGWVAGISNPTVKTLIAGIAKEGTSRSVGTTVLMLVGAAQAGVYNPDESFWEAAWEVLSSEEEWMHAFIVDSSLKAAGPIMGEAGNTAVEAAQWFNKKGMAPKGVVRAVEQVGHLKTKLNISSVKSNLKIRAKYSKNPAEQVEAKARLLNIKRREFSEWKARKGIGKWIKPDGTSSIKGIEKQFKRFNEEIAQLREDIKELDPNKYAEIQLTETIERIDIEQSELSTEKSEIQQRIEEITQEHTERLNQLKSLHNAKNKVILKQKISELENLLGLYSKSKSSLEQKIEKTLAEIESYKTEIATIKGNKIFEGKNIYKQQIDLLKAEIKTLKDLKKLNKGQQKTLAQKQEALENLKTNLEQSPKDAKRLQILEKGLRTANENLETAQKELNTFNEKIEKADRELTENKQKLEVIENSPEYEEINLEIDEIQNEIKKLEEISAEVAKKKENTEEGLERLEREEKKLSKKLQKLIEKIERHRQKNLEALKKKRAQEQKELERSQQVKDATEMIEAFAPKTGKLTVEKQRGGTALKDKNNNEYFLNNKGEVSKISRNEDGSFKSKEVIGDLKNWLYKFTNKDFKKLKVDTVLTRDGVEYTVIEKQKETMTVIEAKTNKEFEISQKDFKNYNRNNVSVETPNWGRRQANKMGRWFKNLTNPKQKDVTVPNRYRFLGKYNPVNIIRKMSATKSLNKAQKVLEKVNQTDFPTETSNPRKISPKKRLKAIKNINKAIDKLENNIINSDKAKFNDFNEAMKNQIKQLESKKATLEREMFSRLEQKYTQQYYKKSNRDALVEQKIATLAQKNGLQQAWIRYKYIKAYETQPAAYKIENAIDAAQTQINKAGDLSNGLTPAKRIELLKQIYDPNTSKNGLFFLENGPIAKDIQTINQKIQTELMTEIDKKSAGLDPKNPEDVPRIKALKKEKENLQQMFQQNIILPSHHPMFQKIQQLKSLVQQEIARIEASN